MAAKKGVTAQEPFTLEQLIAARDTLHLPPRATWAQVERSFKRLMKRYHPDRATTPDEASAFHLKAQKLIEARELLARFREDVPMPLTDAGYFEAYPEERWKYTVGAAPSRERGGR
ncbi:MAG: hypothetical protein COX57_01550 [Alphaproteobacteria bacterium CG_4_10_14_0_2_um_filter_63_37]|nr:MAG: hypothetical protein AUJ55_01230 [Proteobacteria bacterium CG1_02_64_396]PJA25837.1 MAG: hypothetical protein COX57_01550 [Alphaproteobacteria bacterium CG_4_10_14_0_2_um_filter_63_37]